MEQASSNPTVTKMAIGAMTAGYIKQLSGSRAAKRQLGRKRVKGMERDLLQAMLSHNKSMSGHIAYLELAPRIAKALDAMKAFVQDKRSDLGDTTPEVLRLQAMANEIEARFKSREGRSPNWKMLDAAMELTFLSHLATPSYSFANAHQPMQLGHAALAHHQSDGAAGRLLSQAYWDLGARSAVWAGMRETVAELKQGAGSLIMPWKLKQLPRELYDHDAATREQLAKLGDGKLLVKAQKELENRGLSAAGGIEVARLTEVGMNVAQVAVHRQMRWARAAPEAVERINRTSVLIAGVRQGKEMGLSDEDAIQHGVDIVEQTQGGYAADNNPRAFQGKYGQLPLMFKKYSVLFGQAFVKNMVNFVSLNASYQERKQAANFIARLSVPTTIFAGVGGLPFVELARYMMLASNLLGISDDDTWDDKERELEAWYRKLYTRLWGRETAKEAAETMFHGLYRSFGIDMSGRLGNEGLITFSDPKKLERDSVKAWLFDLAFGAPGGFFSKLTDQIHEPNLDKFPLPKLVQDTIDAFNQDTWAAAAAKVFGLRLAEESRQYEVGGEKAKKREQFKLKQARTNLMTEYYEATAGRKSILRRTKIAAWNRRHSSKAERIELEDLKRSKATRDKNKEVVR